MMNEFELLKNSAFACAINIVEHIEQTVNEYMQENDISLEDWQQNGEYSEVQTIDGNGRSCFLSYKKEIFHRFKYNDLGIITV